MGKIRRLAAPFEWTRWNAVTFMIALAIGVTGAHFVLTPVVGVPEPAGFFVATVALTSIWLAFVRRPHEKDA